MPNNPNLVNKDLIEKLSQNSSTPIFIPYKSEKTDYIVCDMCGHKNDKDALICENCSNYLK